MRYTLINYLFPPIPPKLPFCLDGVEREGVLGVVLLGEVTLLGEVVLVGEVLVLLGETPLVFGRVVGKVRVRVGVFRVGLVLIRTRVLG